MATRQNVVASPMFSCAVCHGGAGLLQTPPPDDVGQVLTSSYPASGQSAPSVDMQGVSSALGSAPGNLNDLTKDHNAPTSGTVQLKSGAVRLYRLVTSLVIQITAIASAVVSLKDRITAVEGIQTPASACSQEAEVLRRQVSKLYERVAYQEDRIASLEILQRAETKSYKKTIEELTTKIDGMKIDDDKKARDDALENLRDSLKISKLMIECQSARISGVKADTSRKIAHLQLGLAGVRTELTAVKMIATPVNASSASQAAKGARRKRILASIAQRMEDVEMAEETEMLCPLPPVIARRPVRAAIDHHVPSAPISSDGRSITLLKYSETRETTDKVTKEPLGISHTNAARPSADTISAMFKISMPTVSTKHLIPTKGNGKENKPCNGSTKETLQDAKTSKPGVGRSLDISEKPSTASHKEAQSDPGVSSEVSILPKLRRSKLVVPWKSLLPSFAEHAVVADGKGVEATNRLPEGSAARTKLPRTAKIAPVITSRSRLASGSASSWAVERDFPIDFSASSSLEALDAVLRTMGGDDLLMRMPTVDCPDDGLSFSTIVAPMGPTKVKRNTKNESIYVPLGQKTKLSRKGPLKFTAATSAENAVFLLPSSTPAATMQRPRGKDDVLTLMPGPDCPRATKFSILAAAPTFIGTKPPCSVYASPAKTSVVKPSRRL